MTCKTPFLAGDPKPATIIPKMVSLFEGMDAAVGSIFLKNGSHLHISDSGNMGVKELPTTATKENLDIARDRVSVKQEVSDHELVVYCNKDSDKDRNCQVTEPGKINFPPILPSNAGFAETNAIAEVDMLEPAIQCGILDSGNMGAKELPTTAIKQNLDIARDRVSVKQEVSSHELVVCCNKDSDKDNNCQVNEPINFPPIPSSNAGFAETNAIAKVDMVEPAIHSAGGVPDTGLSQKTINRKSTLKRPVENSREPKRQKLIECAFCGTFRNTEGSGPMQHYLKGKQITEKEVNQDKVIHVHQKCINWAPRVYFKDDTAINLEKEISRALKLKCSKCGQKGAALGCYYEHCNKTFHVPCAYDTPGCRWDCVEMNVLCPSHISKELPCDKYGKVEMHGKGETSGTKDLPLAKVETHGKGETSGTKDLPLAKVETHGKGETSYTFLSLYSIRCHV